MRIIAGALGGRTFDSPGTHRTHPMSDKARGALFNMLGDIEGLRVLDAFAGSGALSFEAVSRGAAHATALDSDPAAQKTIRRNIQALGLHNTVQLVAAAAGAWLQTSPVLLFDIVLCDPPYDHLQPGLVTRLADRVAKGGLLVVSWPSNQELPTVPECGNPITTRTYGDMQLAFYRRMG